MKVLVIKGADFSANSVQRVVITGWNSFNCVQGFIDIVSDVSSGYRGSIPAQNVSYYPMRVRTIGTIEVPAGITLKIRATSNPSDLRVKSFVVYNHAWEIENTPATGLPDITPVPYWISDESYNYIDLSNFEYTNNSSSSVFVAFVFAKDGGTADVTPTGFEFEYSHVNE